MVPWATRHVPRRWMYTVGAGLYLLAMALVVQGGAITVPLGLMCSAMATATTFVCFNAYVLDYVARAELGRVQSMQMVYAATPWAVGPLLGVWLRSIWAPLPFVVAGGIRGAFAGRLLDFAAGQWAADQPGRGPALNPLAYLGRFFAQPG